MSTANAAAGTGLKDSFTGAGKPQKGLVHKAAKSMATHFLLEVFLVAAVGVPLLSVLAEPVGHGLHEAVSSVGETAMDWLTA